MRWWLSAELQPAHQSTDLFEGLVVMDGIDMEKAVDPIALFAAWMKAAAASEPNDASAVALATATRDGVPSVRMVLMKRADELGFRFYTNAESRKGVGACRESVRGDVLSLEIAAETGEDFRKCDGAVC